MIDSTDYIPSSLPLTRYCKYIFFCQLSNNADKAIGNTSIQKNQNGLLSFKDSGQVAECNLCLPAKFGS